MYRLSVDGVVRISDELFIPYFLLESNELYQEYSRWVEAGNIPEPMNLSDIKILKIRELKEKCQNEITDTYPVWKQININELQGYAAEQKTAMWSFINSKRNRCNSLETQVNACATISEVNALVW